MLSPLRGILTPLGVAWASPIELWWPVAGQTCVAAYQPIGAASLAASYVNLANPGTYDAAPGVAPTLGAAGWVFNGTKYLTTGIVPTNNQQWSAIVRYADATANNGCLFAVSDAGGDFAILPIANTTKLQYDNGGVREVNTALPAGILAIAGAQGYRNGVADGVAIPAAGTTRTLDLAIGADHYSGGYILRFVGTIAALAIYSTTLSAADVAALTLRMQNLT